jgi:acyl-CoA reductase-like NAD-dependent aldehyde dehydrogenase
MGFVLGRERVTAGEPVEVRSPHDQSLVGATWNAGAAEMERAIGETARAAAMMRELPSYRRAEILRGIASRIEQRKAELTRVLCLEAGKPLKAARVEVERAAFTFTVAAEEATRIGGEVLPLDLLPATAGRFAITRRFPVGPIACITPFNFPVNLVAHKAGPAIAAGCTILLKPAPQTPFSALLLNEMALDAGLPHGAWNTLPCSNEVAAQMVRDDRMQMLSFTGSAAVGWQLKQQARKKRVTLELGGNAGVIVHRDADLDYAAERCAFGGFSYAGQSCISVQRILVHREALTVFLERLVSRVKGLRVGDPLDETTDVGPLIRPADADRVAAWIAEAVAGGAQAVAGGGRRGNAIEPTVLTGTHSAMKVNCLEVFGPVVTVEPFDDFERALNIINDSPFGLQAGVFTRDAGAIFRAYQRLEVGAVVAGDVPTFRIDHMPYGGTKDSGLGREGLRYAIEEMTEPKLLVMNLPS